MLDRDPINTVHETVDFETLTDREWSQRAARLSRRCLAIAETQRERVDDHASRLSDCEREIRDLKSVNALLLDLIDVIMKEDRGEAK